MAEHVEQVVLIRRLQSLRIYAERERDVLAAWKAGAISQGRAADLLIVHPHEMDALWQECVKRGAQIAEMSR